MKYENLTIENDGAICVVTINRPESLNALNNKTLTELEHVFDMLTDNNTIRVVILTGSGTKSFVAGADIKEFLEVAPANGGGVAQRGQDIFFKIENLNKPVIAAVNGFALGGGCELAMACHLRIASENAKFAQPEVNLGIIAGYGGTQRLIQYVGKTKAMELHLTGDMINAAEAQTLGLVNNVVPIEQLLDECKKIAAKIISKSPEAVAGVIRSINAYFEEGTNGYKVEVEEFGKVFNSGNFIEGVHAFIEKRKPNFK